MHGLVRFLPAWTPVFGNFVLVGGLPLAGGLGGAVREARGLWAARVAP